MQISNKHYRKYFEDELENNTELFSEKVFTSIDIFRGQSRGLSKSWFNIFSRDQEDESGEVTNKKKVGYFKGRINVYNEEDEKEFRANKETKMKKIFSMIKSIYKKVYDNQEFPFTFDDCLNSHEKQQKVTSILESFGMNNAKLIEFMKDEVYRGIINKQLQTQVHAAVQVYVLEAYDLASRDIGSFSDPYLKIRFGNEEKSFRDKYRIDEANPDFNLYAEFKGNFPGAPPLVIDCMDYDDLFGDDLIGTTSIDLDDRFFSGDWQALDEKPIEYRQIYHPSTSLS